MVLSQKSSRSLLLVFLLLLVIPCRHSQAAPDWFAAIDADHNGQVDKSEWDTAMLKLEHGLGEMLPPAEESWFSQWISNHIFSPKLKFWPAFTSSVAMILATEIGDKTFFIAAVMSMRHDRTAVFSGAIIALVLMTVLSSMMGLILPSFMDRQYTHILGGILFLYFGFKLILDSRKMQKNKVSEELEEVEEELGHDKKRDVESQSEKEVERVKDSAATAILIQSFSLTFLAEWGDRSQIATIALAAAKDPIGVTVGASVGHCFCTGMAVIGGRMLASRISEKSVSLWGGVLFLLFGLHSIFFEH